MRNRNIKEDDIPIPPATVDTFRKGANMRLRVSEWRLGMKKLKQEKSSQVFVDNYSKKSTPKNKAKHKIYGLCRKKDM